MQLRTPLVERCGRNRVVSDQLCDCRHLQRCSGAPIFGYEANGRSSWARTLRQPWTRGFLSWSHASNEAEPWDAS